MYTSAAIAGFLVGAIFRLIHTYGEYTNCKYTLSTPVINNILVPSNIHN
jgi:hypothetical protein